MASRSSIGPARPRPATRAGIASATMGATATMGASTTVGASTAMGAATAAVATTATLGERRKCEEGSENEKCSRCESDPTPQPGLIDFCPDHGEPPRSAIFPPKKGTGPCRQYHECNPSARAGECETAPAGGLARASRSPFK